MQSSLFAALTSPAASIVALAIQALGVLGLFTYGVGQAHLLYLYVRRGPRPVTPPTGTGELPFVTVQIPMYNERHVAREVMNACAALDWPRDRFELQILDDSADDTVAIIDERADYWRAQGIAVQVVRRAHRTGYKAGALAHGTPQARGEFLAIFDADFRPYPDFLRRIMPRFADARVGFVQGRWGHLNRTWSLLTRAQAVVLDAFFVVEQEARHRAGFIIRFNGSAGVWRAAAIADAGGWHADTLSEDYDLALRAQLRGWRGDYAVDVVAPAELPVTMLDYKVQQTRWARGRGQVIRKLVSTLWHADLPPMVKAHVLFDMFNILTVPSLLLIAFSSPWVALVLLARPSAQPVGIAMAIVQLPLNIVLVPTFLWMSVRQYGRTVAGTARELAAAILPFMLLILGANVMMLAAFRAGLAGGAAVFYRTSKYNLGGAGSGASDSWRSSIYRPSEISPVTWIEGATAALFVAVCALDISLGLVLWLPFHLFLSIGFGAMFGLSLVR